jgi:hypothetical protein
LILTIFQGHEFLHAFQCVVLGNVKQSCNAFDILIDPFLRAISNLEIRSQPMHCIISEALNIGCLFSHGVTPVAKPQRMVFHP